MNVIEMNNLYKYYGKSRGIIDVSLSVREGEIFGFIGPNGAGKSTAIRTLLNFIFPSSGNATIFGLDVVKNSKLIKNMVGYLPGEVDYYKDMTVSELLDFSARFYEIDNKRIQELSNIFELDMKKKINALSLGNKKKVGICQALLHSPKLLILDEPTSGLDPLMQHNFFDLLSEENNKGTTIFFSSHVLSEVQRLCKRIAIIKEGKIIRIETLEELRKSQFRKIRLTFLDNEIPELNLDGIIHREMAGRTLILLFNGDINLLLKTLSQYTLESIWLEEPTLEEVFINYYEKEAK